MNVDVSSYSPMKVAHITTWSKMIERFTIQEVFTEVNNQHVSLIILTTASAKSGHKQIPKNSIALTPIRIAVYRVPQKIVPKRSVDWSTIKGS